MTAQWLYRALEESRARGFLGPMDIDTQISHSIGFATVWDGFVDTPPDRFLDLGSGGGLPGLVLLERWGTPATFVDSMIKRTTFLDEVMTWEGAPPGATIVNGRAEEISRKVAFDGQFPLVTARSFGPPSVTAECSARFLALNGLLIVSEPPNDDDTERWNLAALGQLGLRSLGRVRQGAAYHVLHKVRATPERYPRGIGTPGKSPLF